MAFSANSFEHNWQTLKENPLGEIAGSLGDLGTLLPLMTALTAGGSISLTATLIFSGVFNVYSGAFFGIPIVVQPMKAVASIALARQLSLKETMAAGIGVGIVVMLLSIVGMIKKAADLIPLPIVKGIQVGAGLSLCLNAGSMLSSLSLNGSKWDDNLFWAIGAFSILYGFSRLPKFPFALLVFLLGGIFAAIEVATSGGGGLPAFGFWWPFNPTIPTPTEFATGFGTAGVGQIPLTILNSVIAVRYLSEDLMPARPAPSVTALGISVGFMNLTGCWFGAMPVCHGSGGLAAQHRFGARSGTSVILLGLVKIGAGLAFGESLASLLQRFPKSLLGIMVFAAGIELASVAENLNSSARDLLSPTSATLGTEQSRSAIYTPLRVLTDREKKERFLNMMVTAAMMLASKNTFVGFLAGVFFWALLRLQDRMEGLREARASYAPLNEASALLGR
ncbi:hypothetical protein C7212DRAFT_351778 [Tuber magnatum]|uniref:Sulfate transporter n=1 Tax=Tuber magnatum TaxID=42249 RepID=A0A317SQ95_9PEZI|nr:hypothetical protein C7212DRAFT_351778 [Tuber magnatum]